MSPTDPAEASPLPGHHLEASPTEGFWLDDLGFAGYRTIAPGFDDPVKVAGEVEQAFKAGELKTRLTEVLGGLADVEAAHQHLVLLLGWTAKLKTAALVDVARAELDAATIARWRGDTGRWNRLGLVLELYAEDPDTLRSVLMCDRWHSRRRCVMQVFGRAPLLKNDLDADSITEATSVGLAKWKRSRPGRPRITVLQTFRRSPDEVLVAFRRPSGIGSLRDDDDKLITGFREEPVILRFKERGRRVDVTADRLDEAVGLAAAIVGALLGKSVTLRKRRSKVTEKVLNDLLARLCNPDADDLQLVEIKAEMPGEPHRPTKVICGTGKNRIERTVAREAERATFARDWKTVHSVKVYFEGYRFTVQFPPPDGELTLTYSDLNRDTGVAEQFEAVIEMLRDEFGADISILPRSKDPAGSAPRRERPGKPRAVTADHRRRLLAPTVDDPLPWELRELEKLEADSMVAITDAWFFRCGDPTIDRLQAGVPSTTLDCDGEVEWEASITDGDPLGFLDGAEQSCSACRTEWDLARYRPPIHRRLHVILDAEATFDVVVAKLKRTVKLEVEAPGIASGLKGGERIYLAFLPLADPVAARAKARGHNILWLGGVADPRLAGLVPSMDLAEFLSGEAARKRLVGAAIPMSADPPPPPPPPASARRALGAPNRAPLRSAPTYGEVALVEGRVMFYAYDSAESQAAREPSRTWEIAKPHSVGSRILLALLVAAAEPGAAIEGRGPLRTVNELTRLHPIIETKADPQTFYKWVKRTRGRLDKVAVGLGRLVVDGDDPVGGRASRSHGYRLGDRYPVRGFQLGAEAENWKAHGKNA